MPEFAEIRQLESSAAAPRARSLGPAELLVTKFRSASSYRPGQDCLDGLGREQDRPGNGAGLRR